MAMGTQGPPDEHLQEARAQLLRQWPNPLAVLAPGLETRELSPEAPERAQGDEPEAGE
jgi:hypothetical protein